MARVPPCKSCVPSRNEAEDQIMNDGACHVVKSMVMECT